MRSALAVLLALVAVLAGVHDARAFCGFYVGGADTKLFNNATMVVLMRSGTRTVLSMQNNYQGPPSDFAMVVPVPVVLQKENVKTLPAAIFDHVDKAAAPRLVEYWEQDPCPPPDLDFARGRRYEATSAAAPASTASAAARDLGVRVEAEFTVGEYEVVILSAEDALGLDTWLRQNRYKIPEGAEPLLRPYVQSGMKFFVAKVNASKVRFENGQAMLSPLRFHYDSESFSLPIRLGLVNSGGTQDLIVHILAKDQRYEVANYPNVTIPTNLDVAESARDAFGGFYASLFDATVARHKGAVVTEYAWAANTCDPCPGPTLQPAELMSLGADVLPGNGSQAMNPWQLTNGFVLTRLHARYTKDALGDDLVFRAAPGIVGGREARASYPDGALEHGANPSTYNNFQGRYAIRHAWSGPILCTNPRRGIWGGPPKGVQGSAQPRAAQNTAFVPRDARLESFLRSDVPELGVIATGASVSGAPLGTGTTMRLAILAGVLAVVAIVVWRRRRRAA